MFVIYRIAASKYEGPFTETICPCRAPQVALTRRRGARPSAIEAIAAQGLRAVDARVHRKTTLCSEPERMYTIDEEAENREGQASGPSQPVRKT